MESIDWREDPVIEEIRVIREAIHEETKGLTSQERADWYNAQAEKAMADFRASKSSKAVE